MLELLALTANNCPKLLFKEHSSSESSSVNAQEMIRNASIGLHTQKNFTCLHVAAKKLPRSATYNLTRVSVNFKKSMLLRSPDEKELQTETIIDIWRQDVSNIYELTVIRGRRSNYLLSLRRIIVSV